MECLFNAIHGLQIKGNTKLQFVFVEQQDAWHR
jgi:hypothetical protein